MFHLSTKLSATLAALILGAALMLAVNYSLSPEDHQVAKPTQDSETGTKPMRSSGNKINIDSPTYPGSETKRPNLTTSPNQRNRSGNSERYSIPGRFSVNQNPYISEEKPTASEGRHQPRPNRRESGHLKSERADAANGRTIHTPQAVRGTPSAIDSLDTIKAIKASSFHAGDYRQPIAFTLPDGVTTPESKEDSLIHATQLSFSEILSTGAPDPASPEYADRWRIAVESHDDFLRRTLGWDRFNQLSALAAQKAHQESIGR